jgi:hypothetical protein
MAMMDSAMNEPNNVPLAAQDTNDTEMTTDNNNHNLNDEPPPRLMITKMVISHDGIVVGKISWT